MKVQIESNFLDIQEQYSNLENSKIVIIQAPYEHTVSYGGGAAQGPQGIIDSSAYVEFYDDEFDNELCFDKGIATLEPLNFDGIYDQDALDLIYDQAKSLLNSNKFVVTLGGEHTISTAPIKAHFEKYPNMSILHFDAHSDLRDSYQGSIYSHASFMARVSDFFPTNKITQVGIRAQCIEEARFIKEKGVNTFYASAIRRGLHGDNWQQAVVDTLTEQVYVSFDVDYFDPSIMPSTGTPEPDGFMYNETLDLFRKLVKSGKKIIGFDIVELSPVKGVNYPDITASRLLYKMLNYAFVR